MLEKLFYLFRYKYIKSLINRLTRLKAMSLCLALMLFIEPIALAAPTSPLSPVLWNTDLSASFTIPKSIATIDDVYKSPTADTSIILIQDAHTNESAQLNIARTLELLSKQESITHVFLEAGEGDLSLAQLKEQSSIQKRKQVGLDFVKKGLLQGSEYFDLTTSQDVTLWGAEDMRLYDQDLELYRQVAQGRETLEKYLAKVNQTQDFLKEKIFNPMLYEINCLQDDYSRESISISEYIGKLLKFKRLYNLKSKTRYPNLNQFKKLQSQEKRIDFERVNQEYTELLSQSSQDNAFALTPISLDREQNALLEQLQSLAKTSNQTPPEIRKYIHYLKRVTHLDIKRVLSELEILENEISKSLISTQGEKQLWELSKHVQVLKGVIEFQLESKDHAYLDRKSELITFRAITGLLNQKIFELKDYQDKAIFLDESADKLLEQAKTFYMLTIQRDQAFLTNVIQKMSADHINKAVLITGGYHTPHLKVLFKKEDISYTVIQPAVTHPTNHARYEKILLSQTPTTTPTKTEKQLTLSPMPTRMAGSRLSFVDLAQALGIPNEELTKVTPNPKRSAILSPIGRKDLIGEDSTELDSNYRDPRPTMNTGRAVATAPQDDRRVRMAKLDESGSNGEKIESNAKKFIYSILGITGLVVILSMILIAARHVVAVRAPRVDPKKIDDTEIIDRQIDNLDRMQDLELTSVPDLARPVAEDAKELIMGKENADDGLAGRWMRQMFLLNRKAELDLKERLGLTDEESKALESNMVTYPLDPLGPHISVTFPGKNGEPDKVYIYDYDKPSKTVTLRPNQNEQAGARMADKDSTEHEVRGTSEESTGHGARGADNQARMADVDESTGGLPDKTLTSAGDREPQSRLTDNRTLVTSDQILDQFDAYYRDKKSLVTIEWVSDMMGDHARKNGEVNKAFPISRRESGKTWKDKLSLQLGYTNLPRTDVALERIPDPNDESKTINQFTFTGYQIDPDTKEYIAVGISIFHQEKEGDAPQHIMSWDPRYDELYRFYEDESVEKITIQHIDRAMGDTARKNGAVNNRFPISGRALGETWGDQVTLQLGYKNLPRTDVELERIPDPNDPSKTINQFTFTGYQIDPDTNEYIVVGSSIFHQEKERDVPQHIMSWDPRYDELYRFYEDENVKKVTIQHVDQVMGDAARKNGQVNKGFPISGRTSGKTWRDQLSLKLAHQNLPRTDVALERIPDPNDPAKTINQFTFTAYQKDPQTDELVVIGRSIFHQQKEEVPVYIRTIQSLHGNDLENQLIRLERQANQVPELSDEEKQLPQEQQEKIILTKAQELYLKILRDIWNDIAPEYLDEMYNLSPFYRRLVHNILLIRLITRKELPRAFLEERALHLASGPDMDERSWRLFDLLLEKLNITRPPGVSLDRAFNMLRVSQEKDQEEGIPAERQPERVQADLLQLPFANKSFKRVEQGSLHLIPLTLRPQAIREANRVLEPNGVLSLLTNHLSKAFIQSMKAMGFELIEQFPSDLTQDEVNSLKAFLGDEATKRLTSKSKGNGVIAFFSKAFDSPEQDPEGLDFKIKPRTSLPKTGSQPKEPFESNTSSANPIILNSSHAQALVATLSRRIQQNPEQAAQTGGAPSYANSSLSALKGEALQQIKNRLTQKGGVLDIIRNFILQTNATGAFPASQDKIKQIAEFYLISEDYYTIQGQSIQIVREDLTEIYTQVEHFIKQLYIARAKSSPETFNQSIQSVPNPFGARLTDKGGTEHGARSTDKNSARHGVRGADDVRRLPHFARNDSLDFNAPRVMGGRDQERARMVAKMEEVQEWPKDILQIKEREMVVEVENHNGLLKPVRLVFEKGSNKIRVFIGDDRTGSIDVGLIPESSKAFLFNNYPLENLVPESNVHFREGEFVVYDAIYEGQGYGSLIMSGLMALLSRYHLRFENSGTTFVAPLLSISVNLKHNGLDPRDASKGYYDFSNVGKVQASGKKLQEQKTKAYISLKLSHLQGNQYRVDEASSVGLEKSLTSLIDQLNVRQPNIIITEKGYIATTDEEFTPLFHLDQQTGFQIFHHERVKRYLGIPTPLPGTDISLYQVKNTSKDENEQELIMAELSQDDAGAGRGARGAELDGQGGVKMADVGTNNLYGSFKNTLRGYVAYPQTAVSDLSLDDALSRAREIIDSDQSVSRNSILIQQPIRTDSQQLALSQWHVPEHVQTIAVRAHNGVKNDEIYFIELLGDSQTAIDSIHQYLSTAYPERTSDLELGVATLPSGDHDTIMITVNDKAGQAPVVNPILSQPIQSFVPDGEASVFNHATRQTPGTDAPSVATKFHSLLPADSIALNARLNAEKGGAVDVDGVRMSSGEAIVLSSEVVYEKIRNALSVKQIKIESKPFEQTKLANLFYGTDRDGRAVVVKVQRHDLSSSLKKSSQRSIGLSNKDLVGHQIDQLVPYYFRGFIHIQDTVLRYEVLKRVDESQFIRLDHYLEVSNNPSLQIAIESLLKLYQVISDIERFGNDRNQTLIYSDVFLGNVFLNPSDGRIEAVDLEVSAPKNKIDRVLALTNRNDTFIRVIHDVLSAFDMQAVDMTLTLLDALRSHTTEPEKLWSDIENELKKLQKTFLQDSERIGPAVFEINTPQAGVEVKSTDFMRVSQMIDEAFFDLRTKVETRLGNQIDAMPNAWIRKNNFSRIVDLMSLILEYEHPDQIRDFVHAEVIPTLDNILQWMRDDKIDDVWAYTINEPEHWLAIPTLYFIGESMQFRRMNRHLSQLSIKASRFRDAFFGDHLRHNITPEDEQGDLESKKQLLLAMTQDTLSGASVHDVEIPSQDDFALINSLLFGAWQQMQDSYYSQYKSLLTNLIGELQLQIDIKSYIRNAIGRVDDYMTKQTLLLETDDSTYSPLFTIPSHTYSIGFLNKIQRYNEINAKVQKDQRISAWEALSLHTASAPKSHGIHAFRLQNQSDTYEELIDRILGMYQILKEVVEDKAEDSPQIFEGLPRMADKGGTEHEARSTSEGGVRMAENSTIDILMREGGERGLSGVYISPDRALEVFKKQNYADQNIIQRNIHLIWLAISTFAITLPILANNIVWAEAAFLFLFVINLTILSMPFSDSQDIRKTKSDRLSRWIATIVIPSIQAIFTLWLGQKLQQQMNPRTSLVIGGIATSIQFLVGALTTDRIEEQRFPLSQLDGEMELQASIQSILIVFDTDISTEGGYWRTRTQSVYNKFFGVNTKYHLAYIVHDQNEKRRWNQHIDQMITDGSLPRDDADNILQKIKTYQEFTNDFQHGLPSLSARMSDEDSMEREVWGTELNESGTVRMSGVDRNVDNFNRVSLDEISGDIDVAVNDFAEHMGQEVLYIFSDEDEARAREWHYHGLSFLGLGAEMLTLIHQDYPGLVFKVNPSDRKRTLLHKAAQGLLAHAKIGRRIVNIGGVDLVASQRLAPMTFYKNMVIQARAAPVENDAWVQGVVDFMRSQDIRIYDQGKKNFGVIDGTTVVTDLDLHLNINLLTFSNQSLVLPTQAQLLASLNEARINSQRFYDPSDFESDSELLADATLLYARNQLNLAIDQTIDLIIQVAQSRMTNKNTAERDVQRSGRDASQEKRKIVVGAQDEGADNDLRSRMTVGSEAERKLVIWDRKFAGWGARLLEGLTATNRDVEQFYDSLLTDIGKEFSKEGAWQNIDDLRWLSNSDEKGRVNAREIRVKIPTDSATVLKALALYLLNKSLFAQNQAEPFLSEDLDLLNYLIARYNADLKPVILLTAPSLFVKSLRHYLNDDDKYFNLSMQLNQLPKAYRPIAVALNLFAITSHLSNVHTKEDMSYDIEIAIVNYQTAVNELKRRDLTEFERQALEMSKHRALQLLLPVAFSDGVTVPNIINPELNVRYVWEPKEYRKTQITELRRLIQEDLRSIDLDTYLTREVRDSLAAADFTKPLTSIETEDPLLLGLTWFFEPWFESVMLQPAIQATRSQEQRLSLEQILFDRQNPLSNQVLVAAFNHRAQAVAELLRKATDIVIDTIPEGTSEDKLLAEYGKVLNRLLSEQNANMTFYNRTKIPELYQRLEEKIIDVRGYGWTHAISLSARMADQLEVKDLPRLFDESSVAVWYARHEGDDVFVEYVNPAFGQVYGSNVQAILDKRTYEEINGPGDHNEIYREEDRKAIEDGIFMSRGGEHKITVVKIPFANGVIGMFMPMGREDEVAIQTLEPEILHDLRLISPRLADPNSSPRMAGPKTIDVEIDNVGQFTDKRGREITVRKAKAEDVDDVVDLWFHSYAPNLRLPSLEARNKDIFRGEIEENIESGEVDSGFWIATHDQTVVGFVEASTYRFETRIDRIAVDENFENAGIGLGLTRALVDDLRKLGSVVTIIVTDQSKNSQTSKIAQALGFTQIRHNKWRLNLGGARMADKSLRSDVDLWKYDPDRIVEIAELSGVKEVSANDKDILKRIADLLPTDTVFIVHRELTSFRTGTGVEYAALVYLELAETSSVKHRAHRIHALEFYAQPLNLIHEMMHPLHRVVFGDPTDQDSEQIIGQLENILAGRYFKKLVLSRHLMNWKTAVLQNYNSYYLNEEFVADLLSALVELAHSSSERELSVDEVLSDESPWRDRWDRIQFGDSQIYAESRQNVQNADQAMLDFVSDLMDHPNDERHQVVFFTLSDYMRSINPKLGDIFDDLFEKGKEIRQLHAKDGSRMADRDGVDLELNLTNLVGVVTDEVREGIASWEELADIFHIQVKALKKRVERWGGVSKLQRLARESKDQLVPLIWHQTRVQKVKSSIDADVVIKNDGVSSVLEVYHSLGGAMKNAGYSDILGKERGETLDADQIIDDINRNHRLLNRTRGQKKRLIKFVSNKALVYREVLAIMDDPQLYGRYSITSLQTRLDQQGVELTHMAVTHRINLIDFDLLNYNRALRGASPINSPMNEKMLEAQNRLLEQLESLGGISYLSELAQVSGLTVPTIQSHIQNIDFDEINRRRAKQGLFPFFIINGRDLARVGDGKDEQVNDVIDFYFNEDTAMLPLSNYLNIAENKNGQKQMEAELEEAIGPKLADDFWFILVDIVFGSATSIPRVEEAPQRNNILDIYHQFLSTKPQKESEYARHFIINLIRAANLTGPISTTQALNRFLANLRKLQGLSTLASTPASHLSTGRQTPQDGAKKKPFRMTRPNPVILSPDGRKDPTEEGVARMAGETQVRLMAMQAFKLLESLIANAMPNFGHWYKGLTIDEMKAVLASEQFNSAAIQEQLNWLLDNKFIMFDASSGSYRLGAVMDRWVRVNDTSDTSERIVQAAIALAEALRYRGFMEEAIQLFEDAIGYINQLNSEISESGDRIRGAIKKTQDFMEPISNLDDLTKYAEYFFGKIEFETILKLNQDDYHLVILRGKTHIISESLLLFKNEPEHGFQIVASATQFDLSGSTIKNPRTTTFVKGEANLERAIGILFANKIITQWHSEISTSDLAKKMYQRIQRKSQDPTYPLQVTIHQDNGNNSHFIIELKDGVFITDPNEFYNSLQLSIAPRMADSSTGHGARGTKKDHKDRDSSTMTDKHVVRISAGRQGNAGQVGGVRMAANGDNEDLGQLKEQVLFEMRAYNPNAYGQKKPLEQYIDFVRGQLAEVDMTPQEIFLREDVFFQFLEFQINGIWGMLLSLRETVRAIVKLDPQELAGSLRRRFANIGLFILQMNPPSVRIQKDATQPTFQVLIRSTPIWYPSVYFTLSHLGEWVGVSSALALTIGVVTGVATLIYLVVSKGRTWTLAYQLSLLERIRRVVSPEEEFHTFVSQITTDPSDPHKGISVPAPTQYELERVVDWAFELFEKKPSVVRMDRARLAAKSGTGHAVRGTGQEKSEIVVGGQSSEKIAVVVDYPEGGGKHPVVLVFPGFLEKIDMELYEAIKTRYIKNGYVVVRADFRNNTLKPVSFNSENESTSKPKAMKFSGALQDARQVIDYVAQEIPEADLSQTTLLGYSLGGWVVRRTAADIVSGDFETSDALQIKTVVDLAGPIDPEGSMHYVMRKHWLLSRLPVWLTRGLMRRWEQGDVWVRFLLGGRQYWFNGDQGKVSTDDIQKIAKANIPYTYVMGSNDKVIIRADESKSNQAISYEVPLQNPNDPWAHLLIGLIQASPTVIPYLNELKRLPNTRIMAINHMGHIYRHELEIQAMLDFAMPNLYDQALNLFRRIATDFKEIGNIQSDKVISLDKGMPGSINWRFWTGHRLLKSFSGMQGALGELSLGEENRLNDVQRYYSDILSYIDFFRSLLDDSARERYRNMTIDGEGTQASPIPYQSVGPWFVKRLFIEHTDAKAHLKIVQDAMEQIDQALKLLDPIMQEILNKDTESKARRTEQLGIKDLPRLFDESSVAVWYAQHEGDDVFVEYANPAFAQVFDSNVQAILDKRTYEEINGPGDHNEIYREEDRTAMREGIFMSRGGEHKITVVKIPFADGVIGMFMPMGREYEVAIQTLEPELLHDLRLVKTDMVKQAMKFKEASDEGIQLWMSAFRQIKLIGPIDESNSDRYENYARFLIEHMNVPEEKEQINLISQRVADFDEGRLINFDELQLSYPALILWSLYIISKHDVLVLDGLILRFNNGEYDILSRHNTQISLLHEILVLQYGDAIHSRAIGAIIVKYNLAPIFQIADNDNDLVSLRAAYTEVQTLVAPRLAEKNGMGHETRSVDELTGVTPQGNENRNADFHTPGVMRNGARLAGVDGLTVDFNTPGVMDSPGMMELGVLSVGEILGDGDNREALAVFLGGVYEANKLKFDGRYRLVMGDEVLKPMLIEDKDGISYLTLKGLGQTLREFKIPLDEARLITRNHRDDERTLREKYIRGSSVAYVLAQKEAGRNYSGFMKQYDPQGIISSIPKGIEIKSAIIDLDMDLATLDLQLRLMVQSLVNAHQSDGEVQFYFDEGFRKHEKLIHKILNEYRASDYIHIADSTESAVAVIDSLSNEAIEGIRVDVNKITSGDLPFYFSNAIYQGLMALNIFVNPETSALDFTQYNEQQVERLKNQHNHYSQNSIEDIREYISLLRTLNINLRKQSIWNIAKAIPVAYVLQALRRTLQTTQQSA